MIEEVKGKKFDEEVGEGRVIVDFWAPWCAPCLMLAPIMEEVAKELEGKVKVLKVNVDENPDIATKFRVMAIPTLIFFKDGSPVRQIVGLRDKKEIIEEAKEAYGI